MQLLNVQDDGFAVPLQTKEGAFQPENVILIIDELKKKIYIWLGKLAAVRKKFVGARAAQKIRFDDMAFVTVTVEEGDDPANEKVIKEIVKKQPLTQPVEVKKFEGKQIATRQGPPPASTSQVPVRREEEISKVVEKPFVPYAPEEEPVTISNSIDARPSLSQATTQINKDLIIEIEKLKVPQGFSREAVIINKSMFTLVQLRRTLFGKTEIENELRKMDSPPDGIYLVSDMTPRIQIKDSKVIFAEFLKKEEIIPETVQKSIEELSDLFAASINKSIDNYSKDISDILK
ncbi:MAG: hypothetical protein ACTSUV_06750 [Candidatus Ranarchaeia archaeon]